VYFLVLVCTMTRPLRRRRTSAAGYSLVELLVAMAITITILGATMSAMTHAMRANETALLVTGMNSNMRTAMDLMVRDMLQIGSGLPPGHFVLIPSGTGATQMNIPGPPGTTFKSAVGDTDLNAVNPGPGLGPTVGGVATDTITMLMADSTFNDVALVARASSGASIDVNPAVNIGSGPDRVTPGQLMMLDKGGYAILLQVTSIDAAAHRIFFAAGDSLNLNQHTTPAGSTAALNAQAPSPDTALPSPQTVPPTPSLHTTVTRVRMVTYYIDNTIPAHPRLARRINNGSHTTFDNNSGSTVAYDIDKLRISYDLADGVGNPANVRFVAADFAGTGACAPAICSVNQIRKVNITLGARSRERFSVTKAFFHTELSTQISLRGMSFVNEYTQ
jgi:type II secretory pathway pseudopilin PulG